MLISSKIDWMKYIEIQHGHYAYSLKDIRTPKIGTFEDSQNCEIT